MNIDFAAILLLLSMNANVAIAEQSKEQSGLIRPRKAPDLPGFYNEQKKAKVILAQGTNYPPYASLGDNLQISGFGPDFAKGLKTVCKIDVILVETDWLTGCWNKKIAPGLLNGDYHGCTTYTNTKGVRNRYLEFTKPILSMNKAAGILTRIENGTPVVDGMSSLDGVNVGDVVGWAPTSDLVGISKNLCTNKEFSGFTLVPNEPAEGENANDVALKQLLDGETDALWIYADQAHNYASKCEEDADQSWDCDMWKRFGTDFAYVQTGSYDYMNTGTTLAMSKKGSGLARTLNPCIDAYIETESYYTLCKKYGLEADCFQNKFFPSIEDEEPKDYSKPTNELSGDCAKGYCPCPTGR